MKYYDTVKEMIDDRVEFGQFYASARDTGDVEEMTKSLCKSLQMDIVKEMMMRGVNITNFSVKEEIESVRDGLRSMTALMVRYGFDIMRIPEKRWKQRLGEKCEIMSKNRLLYTRPCEISVHGEKTSRVLNIEFND